LGTPCSSGNIYAVNNDIEDADERSIERGIVAVFTENNVYG